MERLILREDQWQRIKPLLLGKSRDCGVTASNALYATSGYNAHKRYASAHISWENPARENPYGRSTKPLLEINGYRRR